MSDLFSLAGRTALVTGGSRGIGAMIARGYVEAGAKVYISARKAAECAKTAAELSEHGTCIAIQADLSTEAGCRGLADAIAADQGAILAANADDLARARLAGITGAIRGMASKRAVLWHSQW